MRRALWPLGAVLGIAAELASGAELRYALPDLVTGWTLIAAGLIAYERQGPLLAATGFTWFAGNFAPALLYLHRGPLLHMLFTEPDGRPRDRLQLVAVAVAYAAALVTPVWESEVATIALAAAAVAVGVREHARARGAERRRRRDALVALAALAGALAGGALARLASPTGDLDEAALLAYETVLVGLAIGLALEPRPQPLTDLVVELGERRSDGLAGALGQALGDPTLEVGLHDAGTGAYLDPEGDPIELGRAGRAVTRVERDGAPLAVLVHDPAVLDDPALVRALTTSARMAISNADLQRQVQLQIAELRRSRRRLLAAGDDERARLEQRLHDGARQRLAGLRGTLAHAGGDRARTLLQRAVDDLDALARGLHPRALENGLAGALRELAESSPVPTVLDVTGERFDAELEAGAYFVCAEALANIAKHAGATRAQVRARRDGGRLVLEIADDGAGGVARVDALADRVDTLGGRLRIHSPPGSGTRVTAELPVSRSSASRACRTALR